MIKVCQELPAWAGPYTWGQLVSHTQSYMSHTQSGLKTLKAVSHIPAADSLKKVTDRILPDICCDDSGFAAAPWLQSNHGVVGGWCVRTPRIHQILMAQETLHIATISSTIHIIQCKPSLRFLNVMLRLYLLLKISANASADPFISVQAYKTNTNGQREMLHPPKHTP